MQASRIGHLDGFLIGSHITSLIENSRQPQRRRHAFHSRDRIGVAFAGLWGWSSITQLTESSFTAGFRTELEPK